MIIHWATQFRRVHHAKPKKEIRKILYIPITGTAQKENQKILYIPITGRDLTGRLLLFQGNLQRKDSPVQKLLE